MNRPNLLGLTLAGAAFALLAAPRAEATPIDYTFQVTITSGPLAPETIDGTFAYDSSSVAPGSFNHANGLLTELDFTLNGITYTAATANTSFLEFDGAGDLTGFGFGSDCSGLCSVDINANEWAAAAGRFGFAYSEPGFYDIGFGDVTFAVAVPEPGSLALLGIGLLGFGVAGFTLRRRAA